MNRIVFGISAVIAFVFLPLNLHGQTLTSKQGLTSDEILNAPIDDCRDSDNNPISFTHVSMREFLPDVQLCSRTPMGIVLLSDHNTRRYDIKPRSPKLKDVLEAITVAEPRYK